MAFSLTIADKALSSCGRCCCLCHKFCGIKMQLHHIKHRSEGGKDSFDNCIPLCLDCHGDMRSYDHRHPIGRPYSKKELESHRNAWYAAVAQQGGRPLPERETLDIPTLIANLSIDNSLTLTHRVGSPCVIVAVSCKSKRSAKVSNVIAWIKADRIADAFDKGFGGRLQIAENRPLDAQCDTLGIKLPSLGLKTSEHGFVIKRDDVAKFALPLACPAILHFLNVPADDMGLEVEFFDGTRTQLKAPDLKNIVTNLIQFYGKRTYKLKVTLAIELKAIVARQIDPLPIVGTLNERSVGFGKGQDEEISVDTAQKRMERVCGMFENIWNAWAGRRRFLYRIQPLKNIAGKSLAEMKLMMFLVGVDEASTLFSTKEVVAIFRLIADQCRQMQDAAGNLKDPNRQEYSSLVNLDPSDDEIESTLSRLVFEVG